jgi:hypothetical protein
MPKETGDASRLWGLRTWTAARWREYGFRLVLELLVVFVGVYAASAFARRQQDRQNEARRHQIRLALIQEIQGVIRNTRNAEAQVRQGLLMYEQAAQQKQFRPLQPQIEPVRFQTHMWEATLQSGALDLFEVRTVYQLSEFYNQLNEGFETLRQLRDMSERMLVPVAGAPASEYYDVTTGQVRPKYEWYFDGMRRLARLAGDISDQGDAAIEAMRIQDGLDESQTVHVKGRREVIVRHLVAPELYRAHLPAIARPLTLRDQDLDSTLSAMTKAMPALLDYGIATFRIVQADSFRANGQNASGPYAVWWLNAIDTLSGSNVRFLVPLGEWFSPAIANGPMKAARRPAPTAEIAVADAADGWTTHLAAEDLDIRISCKPGPTAPALPGDLALLTANQRFVQYRGDRGRCDASLTATGNHPLAESLRAASTGPAAAYELTTFTANFQSRVSGTPTR